MKLRNERKLKRFSKDIIAVVLSVAIIGTGSGISTLANSVEVNASSEIVANGKIIMLKLQI